MKTIEIRISKDGSKVTVSADGFKGESCVSATQDIIDSLGDAVKTQYTPDYFETETNPLTEEL